MKRQIIDSSLLTSVGWVNGTLQVQFKTNGEIWNYPNVTQAEYDEMMASESIGSYFMKKIRPVHIGEQVHE